MGAGMKERPILFTPENVRRIRDGQKWQTRRMMEPQPEHVWGFGVGHSDPEHFCAHVRYPGGHQPDPWVRCPHGKPGDRLWVRESLVEEGGQWFYRADRAPVLVDPKDETAMIAWAHHKTTSYASAIHMPRWAARLVLEITGVRIERIQDISYDDMRAEGVRPEQEASLLWRESLAERFRALWDEINGDRGFGWERNPWVWIIDFEVVRK